ncbi:MAG: hypothetical protein NTX59_01435 [Elusimicrobia bacterium]|nr:hypothetical protein [Elusimicrobiota bacterium]
MDIKRRKLNILSLLSVPLIVFLFFCFAFPAPAFSLEQDIKPANVNEAEYSALKDRLSVSLFFRGELADKIMDAGLQNRLLKLDGGETRAQIREALLNWIKKNPDKAANLYFYLSRGGSPGAMPAEIKYSISSWKIHPRFLGLINALITAAGDKKVSDETLNLAADRLFGGPQVSPEAGGVEPGPARTEETAFFSGYADYKLNRAGLERELKNLRTWTDSLRDGFEPAEASKPLAQFFEETFSAYGSFAASASALKPRSALTAEESAGLEKERRFLRGKLAALTLRELAAGVNRAVRGLGVEDAELFREAKALSVNLEKAAGDFEAGRGAPGNMSSVLPAVGRDCAVFCARAGAAKSLAVLRVRRRRTAGFSCLYDYLSWLCFERFYPAGEYVRARCALQGGEALLRRARARLDQGDIEDGSGDLSAELAEFIGSLETVEKISAFNKRAQFFLWGLVFRPAEIEASVSAGKLSFKPAFTFFRLAGG